MSLRILQERQQSKPPYSVTEREREREREGGRKREREKES